MSRARVFLNGAWHLEVARALAGHARFGEENRRHMASVTPSGGLEVAIVEQIEHPLIVQEPRVLLQAEGCCIAAPRPLLGLLAQAGSARIKRYV
jgi:hypothetical protein